MKILFAVLLATGMGFGAAFYLGSSQRAAALRERAQLEAEWRAQVEQLEKELAAAQNKSPRIEQITRETEVAVAARRSAKEILDNLLTLKPTGATRIPVIRKIIHELEDLAELKNQAVPAIRQFFAQNTDLDYAVESSSRDERDRRGPPWSRRDPPMDFSLPPSLRMGLFDVLKQIGSGDAEQVLAEVLGTTGRAVEVSYLAHILEDIAPGKYGSIAVEAAKSLLRNPLPIDNPNRLDESAESYLFGVLEMFHDTTFGEDAAKLMVANGRLDRNARNYLLKTQGEKAIPVLYEAYKNNSVTNDWDRASIASRILDYVGSNPQANNFLSEVVLNPNIDSRMRSFAIMRLTGFGRDEDTPKDPKLAESQIPVLVAIKGNLSPDDPVMRAVDRTLVNLDHIVKGEPVENFRDWGRGGDRDRGRDRPGNGTTPPSQ